MPLLCTPIVKRSPLLLVVSARERNFDSNAVYGQRRYARLRIRCRSSESSGSRDSCHTVVSAPAPVGAKLDVDKDQDDCAQSTKSGVSSQESSLCDVSDDDAASSLCDVSEDGRTSSLCDVSEDEGTTASPNEFPMTPSHLISRHTDVAPARLRVKPIAAVDLADSDDIYTTARNEQYRPTSLNSCHSEFGCTELTPLLFIGGRAIASDRTALAMRGITHVLNMAVECANFFAHTNPNAFWRPSACRKQSNQEESGPFRAQLGSKNDADDYSSDDDDSQDQRRGVGTTCSGIHYHSANGDLVYMHCACTDKSDDDISPYLNALTCFVYEAWKQGGKVLIHCNSGISRSSAAVLACLLRWGLEGNCSHSISLFEAFKWLKERRPIASPHPAYMRQLCDYEVHLRGGNTSINHNTYNNNRYEAPDKLHASIADPRSSARLLGDRARPQDMSPVYCHHTCNFPVSPRLSNESNSRSGRRSQSVSGQCSKFADATISDTKHRSRA